MYIRDWILVTDKLPNIKVPVLLFYKDRIVIGERKCEYPTFEDTFEEFWFWDSPEDDGQDWEFVDVTHWMPLPKPPSI